METAATAYETALDAAFADFRSDLFDASDDFDSEWAQLARVLAHQQTRIDSGLSVASDAFTNPTFDFEVCFVAGTPVLMADGTKKPIEEIQPGDFVLAADHLDPERKPEPARVARFFDNGLKEVVRLRFENGEELTCTPSHPFYVCGRGWVKTDELRDGDLCLTAEGERVAFVARERVEEERRVYNFEVEGRHTYFVGEEVALLAHNTCPICKGTGFYYHLVPHRTIWGDDIYNSEPVLCECIGSQFQIQWKGEWSVFEKVKLILLLSEIKERMPNMYEALDNIKTTLLEIDEEEKYLEIKDKIAACKEVFDGVNQFLNGGIQFTFQQTSFTSEINGELAEARNVESIFYSNRIHMNLHPQANWKLKTDEQLMVTLFHELTHSFDSDDGYDKHNRPLRSTIIHNPLLNANNLGELMRSKGVPNITKKPYFIDFFLSNTRQLTHKLYGNE